MAVTYEALMADLKAKKYSPVYFLCGDEAYFIDKIMDYAEKNILTEAEQSFNQTILYGRDVKMEQILDAAYRLPMMSPYQVLLVKEAQAIANIDLLEKYLQKPVPTTLLFIAMKDKKPDGRKASTKVIKDRAVYLETKKLYENQVPAWIAAYVKDKGYEIEQKAVLLLAEQLGNDISVLVNELSKLFVVKQQGSVINAGDIEEYVGISKDYNIFELTAALSKGDLTTVNRIIQYFSKNPKGFAMPMAIGGLNAYFADLYSFHSGNFKGNPFRKTELQIAAKRFNRLKTEKIITILAEYDLRSKGVNNMDVPATELFREMIFRIIYDNELVYSS